MRVNLAGVNCIAGNGKKSFEDIIDVHEDKFGGTDRIVTL